MKVTVMRIDDRLIHGQIVTRWIDYAEAKKILVVDDKAAADSMQQMLLKLAVPSGITLDVRAIPGERSRDGLELLAKYAAM